MSTALSPRQVGWMACGAGMLLGVGYTLSPLTVLCLPVIVALAWWAGQALSARERQWFVALVSVAVAARLAVVALLFVTADPGAPFATLFGDEQFFKNRSMWLRNVGLGVPISPADFIYAFDEVGESGYLNWLAFLQAVVGWAPYGIQVMNATFYLAGVLAAFRLVRPAFGPAAALAGLTVLLFWPSLFIWSISALKEPSYVLVAIGGFWCAWWLATGERWWHRALAIIGLAVCGFALESVRRGGLSVAFAGAAGGIALAFLARRPRLALVTALALPVIAGVALMIPAVQARALSVGRQSAHFHAGHVGSPGYSYKIIEPRYYDDTRAIQRMPAREVALYGLRAVSSYVTEPLPWNAESRMLKAYLPEQVTWLLMLAFVPLGVLGGLRRDPLVTGLLVAHAVAVMMIVALSSGNIGTLIRHRGLALPYLAWLAGLGAWQLLCALAPSPLASAGGIQSHGHD